MYAVVDIKGFQYKLEKGDTLRVPKYDVKVGGKIKIPEVLLVSDKRRFLLGLPMLGVWLLRQLLPDMIRTKKLSFSRRKGAKIIL